MPVAIEVKDRTAQLNGVGYYAGDTVRLIPAPIVSIAKNYDTTDSNIQIGASLSIQLNGTILPTLGNAVPEQYKTGTTQAHYETASWAGTVDINDDYQNEITDAAHNDRLGVILAKQEALRTLFAGNVIANGDSSVVGNINLPFSRGPVKLILEPLNGTEAFEFLCTCTNVSFEEGLWYERCDYSIDLVCENWSNNLSELGDSFDTEDQWRYKLSSVNESWDIQEDQNTFYFGFLTAGVGTSGTANESYSHKVWNITHNISAVGKRSFTETSNDYNVIEAFENATGVIYDREYGLLGVNKLKSLGGNEYTLPSGLNLGIIGSIVDNAHISDGTLENEYAIGLRSFSEQRDMTAGSVNVTENFIFAPRNVIKVGATEEVSLSIEEDSNSLINSYSLQGTVRGFNTLGLGHTDDNSWRNASGYYSHYVEPFFLSRISRIQENAPSGDFKSRSRINPIPLSKSISRNPISNEISYNVTFDTRRENLTSAIFENIDISEELVGHNYAEIPIIGRREGPIIQYLDSNTSRGRTLNISLVVDVPEAVGTGIVEKARNLFICSNPRQRAPYDSQLSYVVSGVNPVYTGEAPEGAVHDPPQESWNPDTGEYNYTINWKWESPGLVGCV